MVFRSAECWTGQPNWFVATESSSEPSIFKRNELFSYHEEMLVCVCACVIEPVS